MNDIKMSESLDNKASECDNKMSESQIYQVVRIKQASLTRKCQSHLLYYTTWYICDSDIFLS